MPASVLGILGAVDLGAIGAGRLRGLRLLIRHADFADLCSGGPRSQKASILQAETDMHNNDSIQYRHVLPALSMSSLATY